MSLRNPRPALLALPVGLLGLIVGLAACSSSSSGETPPPPTDTGTDTLTDSTLKDTTPGDVADSTSSDVPDAKDSAKPDLSAEVEDTGPPPDEGAVLFACGTETCSKKFNFCRMPTGSSGTPTCILYPPTCGFPSCVCLTTETVTGSTPSCKATPTPTCVDADGAFTITCDKP